MDVHGCIGTDAHHSITVQAYIQKDTLNWASGTFEWIYVTTQWYISY